MEYKQASFFGSLFYFFPFRLILTSFRASELKPQNLLHLESNCDADRLLARMNEYWNE